VFLALFYCIARIAGFTFSFVVLLCLCLGVVALLVGTVGCMFSNRLDSWSWFAVCGVLPLLCLFLPALLWAAPNFVLASVLYMGTSGWSGTITTGLTVAALSMVIFLPLVMPLLHFSLLSAKRLSGWRKLWERPSNVPIILFSLLVVILAIVVLALPPFSSDHRGRIFLTHFTNVSTNSSQIMMALADTSMTKSLQKDLEAAGISTFLCDTSHPAAIFKVNKGLCIAPVAPPQTVQLPTTAISTVDINDGAVAVNISFLLHGNNTTRVLLLFTWPVTRLAAMGREVPDWQYPLPLVYTIGPNSDGAELTLSFETTKERADNNATIFLRVDSTQPYTAELLTVLGKLPTWVSPSGRSSVATPSSLISELHI